MIVSCDKVVRTIRVTDQRNRERPQLWQGRNQAFLLKSL